MGSETPSLFGLNKSNRDFSKATSWSKNKFNSSFPAALIAYMSSKGMPLVYLRLDDEGKLVHDYISASDLFKCDPLDESLYYGFETQYHPFQPYSLGTPPSVDLMISRFRDTAKMEALCGFEVKLTTLPDESTHSLGEDKYGCELVIRMPSIHFLACSLASMYAGSNERLRQYFGVNGFGNPSSYMEAAQVNPRLGEIWQRMNALIKDNAQNQNPAIIQPVWKTKGKSAMLADDCLDVFVWSDLAFTKLFMSEAKATPADSTVAVSRPTRAMIQLFFMLNEVSVRGNFEPSDIFQKLTYTMKNDKAFSVPGRKTQKLMACPELCHPRINKHEIRNIILGGGQNLLSPERRFDAALVNSPDIFLVT